MMNWGKIISKAAFLFLTMLVLAVPLAPALAQEGSRTMGFNGLKQSDLSGRVIDAETGAPIGNATVQIRGAYAQRQNGTDQRGSFAFLKVSAGSYSVIASAPGYRTVSVPVTMTGIDSSGLVVSLRPVHPDAPYEDADAVSLRELLVPGNAREAFSRGADLLHEKKQAAAAVRMFREALEIYPDYDAAYVQLALAYLALDEAGKAKQAAVDAISRNPDNGLALELHARILMGEGRLDEAIGELEKALQVNPASWNAHLQLAHVYEKKGDSALYLDNARNAHELNPGPPQVHFAYYNACAAGGELRAALAELDEILKLYPKNPLAPRLRQLRPELERAAVSAPGSPTQN